MGCYNLVKYSSKPINIIDAHKRVRSNPSEIYIKIKGFKSRPQVI